MVYQRKGEDTEKEKMGSDILPADIDRTHQLGPLLNNHVKLDLLLLSLYVTKIYINKKLLKATKVSITESLTAQRVAKLKEAKEKFGFKNVWSNDGRIICR